MRLLLLGAGGQVGWELQRALAVLGEVLVRPRHGGSAHGIDLARPETLAAAVRDAAPDVIVNAAAHTAVDRCESQPELARAINAHAPAALAEAALASDAWLVHYSSDYVFDGSGSAPRREDDRTGPLGVYGATKLKGEQAIRASGCRHLVVRTSWVHSARGDNFVRTMLRLAGERDALAVVADQVGAPTSAELIADATAHMLRRVASEPARAAELAGTYHLAASGECSWQAYAKHVVAFARSHGRQLRVAADAVRPIASADYPTPARRPANSRLDTGKLRSTFGLALPPWQQGVDRTLTEILSRA